MTRFTAFIVIASLSVGSCLPALADEPGGNLDQRRIEAQQRIEREALAPLPSTGPRAASEILTFVIDNGDLAARTKMDNTQGRTRVPVRDLPGFSTVMVQGRHEEQGAARVFEFTHHSFNTPGAVVVQTQVFATLGYGLQLHRMVESLGEDAVIQFVQMRRFGIDDLAGDQNVTLYVQVSNSLSEETVVDLKLSASNIVELRWLYPRETAEYLDPIFVDLGQDMTVFAVSLPLAWQVFSDAYKPDQAIKAKVDAILPRLNSDHFGEREDALAALEKLGQDGALYLMNIDRSAFSAEQNSLIDTFLATYQPVSAEKAQELAGNAGFLLDCLYVDDPAIRAKALAALENVAGRELTFDPAAPQAERLAAIAQLRKTVLGASTTQPAETAPER